MPQDNEQEKLQNLLKLVQEAVSRDEQLRETYHIGDKFRFIRDRLQELLEHMQKETLAAARPEVSRLQRTTEEGELPLYIHLYNAQGTLFRSWQALFTSKAFFDFGVNRPLYADQAAVEAFISSKTKRQQHAYIAVAVKKECLVQNPEESPKDTLGQPLLKVKENALQLKNLLYFCHNEQIYELNEAGELTKKPSAS